LSYHCTHTAPTFSVGGAGEQKTLPKKPAEQLASSYFSTSTSLSISMSGGCHNT